MTFDWVDDTNEAVAAGELPDIASDAINLNNSFNDISDFQVSISGMIACGTSLLKCFFYKKLGIQNMGEEMAPKEKVGVLETKGAEFSPDDGKWRVKNQSPLRKIMLA